MAYVSKVRSRVQRRPIDAAVRVGHHALHTRADGAFHSRYFFVGFEHRVADTQFVGRHHDGRLRQGVGAVIIFIIFFFSPRIPVYCSIVLARWSAAFSASGQFYVLSRHFYYHPVTTVQKSVIVLSVYARPRRNSDRPSRNRYNSNSTTRKHFTLFVHEIDKQTF